MNISELLRKAQALSIIDANADVEIVTPDGFVFDVDTVGFDQFDPTKIIIEGRYS